MRLRVRMPPAMVAFCPSPALARQGWRLRASALPTLNSAPAGAADFRLREPSAAAPCCCARRGSARAAALLHGSCQGISAAQNAPFKPASVAGQPDFLSCNPRPVGPVMAFAANLTFVKRSLSDDTGDAFAPAEHARPTVNKGQAVCSLHMNERWKSCWTESVRRTTVRRRKLVWR